MISTPLIAGTRVTITRLRAGTIIDQGSEVTDWSSPEELAIPHVKIDPAGTDEVTERRDARQSRYTLQVPDLDADITGTDRVLLPGDTRQWEVVGEPLRQPSLTGIGYLGFDIQIWEG